MLLNSCDTPKTGSPKAHILEGHYSSIAEFIGSGNSQTGKPFAGLTCSISPAGAPLNKHTSFYRCGIYESLLHWWQFLSGEHE